MAEALKQQRLQGGLPQFDSEHRNIGVYEQVAASCIEQPQFDGLLR